MTNKLEEWAPCYPIMILGHILMGLDRYKRTELTTIEQPENKADKYNSGKFEEHTVSIGLELKQIFSSSTVTLIFNQSILFISLYVGPTEFNSLEITQ